MFRTSARSGCAITASIGHDEHVAEPRERGAVGDHAREPDLTAALARIAGERREAERVVERALLNIARHARGPVRVVVEESPHEVAVDVARIARDHVFAHRSLPLHSFVVDKLPTDLTPRDDQVVFAILLLGIFAISFVVLAVILVVTASTGHTLPR